MQNNLILSIVVPTRNRFSYLKLLLKSIIKSDSNQYEIIVTDNSDNDSEIISFINSLNSDKINYYHQEGFLSMSDNFDKGVEKAKGKYVIVLGDDDGILIDESIKFLKKCYDQGIQAIYPKAISYQWPDNSLSTWGSLGGTIDMNRKPFFTKKINAQKELNKQMNYGFGYGLGKLPRVYHGFVLNGCLKKLKEECGTAFPGPSPDMANAVALSTFLENTIFTNKYLVISGHSKKSAGGMGGRKEHIGEIKNIDALPKNTSDLWSEKIPFFWSGPTIYAESARQALVISESKLIDKINYNYLLAILNVYEKNFKERIYLTIQKNNLHFFMPKTKRNFIYIKIFMKRSINFLNNIIKYKFYNMHIAEDIDKATELIINNLNERAKNKN